MIPKVIHYCWFGRGKMPEMAEKCIKSWRKHLPDYEIRLWNEDNFDINSIPYTKEAYQARKYAFVTDYVRLYALYQYGGIYMDTDVEVLKNLDCFLGNPAFSGFEDDIQIPTGIMASEKNGKWAEWMLSYYKDRHFLLEDGTLDLTTNVAIISTMMKEEGFVLQNSLQNFKDIITIYPKDYFCPKSYLDGKIYLTENTYCIHHFAGSWISKRQKIKDKIISILGERNTQLVIKIKRCFKRI